MLVMIIDEIRELIKKSDKSLNQISSEAKVDKAALSRIMNGGSCKVETADKLFKYFGVEVLFKKTKKPAKKSRAKK